MPNNPSPELIEQIAREQAELAAAPLVQSANLMQRCHWCGQLAPDATAAHDYATINGRTIIVNERYRGGCCAPKR